MARRGKRYDGEPKLNIKKVLAVLIVIAVIVMCMTLIIKFATPKENSNSKIVPNSYLTVYSNGKWGVINSSGDIIIEPTYDDMIVIPDPTKAVFIYQTNVNLETGIFDSKAIDNNSKNLFENYEKVEALQNIDSNNIISYDTNALKVSKGEKYGLINFTGNELLACEYDDITPLKGVKNSLVTLKNGKYGLADNSGSIIIENKYTEIIPLTNRYEDGYIVKDENGKYGLINYNRKQLLECKYSKIENITSNNLYVVTENGNKEIVGENGEVKCTYNYDEIVNINTDNIVVRNNSVYGIINLKGETILEPSYEDLRYISEENYIAKKDGKYGIINLQNEIKVEFKYNNIIYMQEENIIQADRQDGLSDLMNTSFDIKVTGIISEINTKTGYLKVRVDNEYKYFNLSLEEKDSKEILTSNTLFVDKKDEKYGFVDKNGIVIVDYIYDDATEQNDYGYAAVKSNGKWGAIDQTGKVVVSTSYDLTQNTVISFIGKWHLGPDLNANYYTDQNE